jgi:hypothetical protein
MQKSDALNKRAPHPKRGYDFELQTFACRVCNPGRGLIVIQQVACNLEAFGRASET